MESTILLHEALMCFFLSPHITLVDTSALHTCGRSIICLRIIRKCGGVEAFIYMGGQSTFSLCGVQRGSELPFVNISLCGMHISVMVE